MRRTMELVTQETQKKHLLVLLIKEIFSQLDEICSLKKRGAPASISSHLLREMCSVLKELDPQMQALYYDVLLTISTTASARSRPIVVSEDYITASQKVKNKFIDQIRTKLRTLAA